MRVAEDGLLERLVHDKPPFADRWVLVVPAGHATSACSWKRWVWLQLHVGVFGLHRNEEKTLTIMSRLVWWKTMKEDVAHWTSQCLTCIRFRKRPTKQDQVAVKPVDCECWEEVMVDCEGASTPADRYGNTHSFTYMCCLCHGILLEPMKGLKHSEVRRALARCIFRSGTLPLMMRSDRGPEFTSTLMREYTALVGTRQRFGMPWRPVEQGTVERVHQITQQVMACWCSRC